MLQRNKFFVVCIFSVIFAFLGGVLYGYNLNAILSKSAASNFSSSQHNKDENDNTIKEITKKYNDIYFKFRQVKQDCNLHMQKVAELTTLRDVHVRTINDIQEKLMGESNKNKESQRNRNTGNDITGYHFWPVCGKDGTSHSVNTCLHKGAVTLILTVYKRNNLISQLQSAVKQSVRPEQIIVMQNENHVNVELELKKIRQDYPHMDIKLIKSEINTRFHGRFLLPFLVRTEFTCIWDDDILPGRDWLKNSMETSMRNNDALVGANGRYIKDLKLINNRVEQIGIGDQCAVKKTTKVDFVGHSWFFKSHFIKFMWQEPWLTWETGEDIQFSFHLQKQGIDTVVAAQSDGENCAHKKHWGVDRFASYKIVNEQMSTFPVRSWLMCAVLRQGFSPQICSDCSKEHVEASEEKLFKLIMAHLQKPFRKSEHDTFFAHSNYQRHEEDQNLPMTLTKSSRSRFIFFVGTRPEIIKIGPVFQAFKAGNFDVRLIFTGQHVDISKSFLDDWNMIPDVSLISTFEQQQSLASLLGKLVLQIEQTVPKNDNDFWIVQGDTTTSLAAGIVAFLRKTPIIHVESGLRTYDNYSPFPEEINRRILGLLSSLHVAPTELCADRLRREGVDAKRIFVLGNSGIDAVRLNQKSNQKPPSLVNIHSRLVLVTLHRRENQQRLSSIYQAIGEVSVHNLTFVIPVHPNPAAGKAARNFCEIYDHFQCVSPLTYLQTQWMLKNSIFVITDSGGLQEEATWYGRAVLVLRDATERTEAISAGSSYLVKSVESLQQKILELCSEPSELLQKMSKKSMPFGDGYTSEKLVGILGQTQTLSILKSPIKMLQFIPGSEKVISDKMDDLVCHSRASQSAMQARLLVADPGAQSRDFMSSSFWEQRYSQNGNSGEGSYGQLSSYKARVINELVEQKRISRVIEFGCGDGANLRLYTSIKSYVGIDVSSTAVRARREEYGGNTVSKSFFEYDGDKSSLPETATKDVEMAMSLDVLYHLIEVDVFIKHLDALFYTASRYVLIYAYDETIINHAKHVFFRRFNPYIKARYGCWCLVRTWNDKPAELLTKSQAIFYLYVRDANCHV